MFIYADFNKGKNIIISESSMKLLSEAMTDVVYHYTSMDSLINIVKTNSMLLQSSIATRADNLNRKELYYLSTTRQRSSNFGYSYKFRKGGARIEFDGEKLSNRYKSIPVDYWGETMGKQSYYTQPKDYSAKQHHTDYESEDRLLSKSPKIDNVYDYIKRIDIIYDPTDKRQNMMVYELLISRFNRKIYVYDNINDFDKQTDNTKNEEILNNDKNYEYLDISSQNMRKQYSGKYARELAHIIQIMFAGEIDNKNYNEEAAKLLRKYGLDNYLNKEFFHTLSRGYYGLQSLIYDTENELHNMSKRPTEEGHRILKLFTDYFNSHNLKNYEDLIKYKTQFSVFSDNIVSNYVDENKVIRFLTYKNDRYSNILIPNPEKTSFWQIVTDKDWFVRTLYNFAEGKNGSKDDESFYKYLQHLEKNNISVSNMLNIVGRLNLTDDEMKEVFDYGTFQFEELDYFKASQYKLPEYADKSNFYGSRDYYNNMNKIKQFYFKK